MRPLIRLMVSLIVAGWIGAIAVLAIQNFSPITLRFLGFQSIEIPLGLALAFSVGLGLVGTAIVQPLLGFSGSDEELSDDL